MTILMSAVCGTNAGRLGIWDFKAQKGQKGLQHAGREHIVDIKLLDIMMPGNEFHSDLVSEKVSVTEDIPII